MKIPESTPDHLEMVGIDHNDDDPIFLNEKDNGKLYIRAYTQCGYDSTDVNLEQLIDWLHKNRPELLAKPSPADVIPKIWRDAPCPHCSGTGNAGAWIAPSSE